MSAGPGTVFHNNVSIYSNAGCCPATEHFMKGIQMDESTRHNNRNASGTNDLKRELVTGEYGGHDATTGYVNGHSPEFEIQNFGNRMRLIISEPDTANSSTKG